MIKVVTRVNENAKKVTQVSEEEKLSVVSQFLQILSGSQAHKQVKIFLKLIFSYLIWSNEHTTLSF